MAGLLSEADLERLLADPQSLSLLLEFTQKNHTEENIEFLNSLRKLRAETNATLRKIYAQYIDRASGSPVNLEGTVVNQIEAQISAENIPFNIFDRAEEAIISLVVQEPLQDFSEWANRQGGIEKAIAARKRGVYFAFNHDSDSHSLHHHDSNHLKPKKGRKISSEGHPDMNLIPNPADRKVLAVKRRSVDSALDRINPNSSKSKAYDEEVDRLMMPSSTRAPPSSSPPSHGVTFLPPQLASPRLKRQDLLPLELQRTRKAQGQSQGQPVAFSPLGDQPKIALPPTPKASGVANGAVSRGPSFSRLSGATSDVDNLSSILPSSLTPSDQSADVFDTYLKYVEKKIQS